MCPSRIAFEGLYRRKSAPLAQHPGRSRQVANCVSIVTARRRIHEPAPVSRQVFLNWSAVLAAALRRHGLFPRRGEQNDLGDRDRATGAGCKRTAGAGYGRHNQELRRHPTISVDAAAANRQCDARRR